MQTRETVPADCDMIRRWRNQPEVSAWMYTDHHIGEEEHARWFHEFLGDPRRRLWIVTHDGRNVGLGGLYDIQRASRRASAAFYLGDLTLRASGVGSLMEFALVDRSFQEPFLDKMCCEVLEENQGVIKGHQTFGFVQEGYLRRHVIKGGRPRNIVVMALFREVWQARREQLAPRLARVEQRMRRELVGS